MRLSEKINGGLSSSFLKNLNESYKYDVNAAAIDFVLDNWDDNELSNFNNADEYIQDLCYKFNDANAEPEYKDEEFYGQEVDYKNILNEVKKRKGLTESEKLTESFEVWQTYFNEDGTTTTEYVQSFDTYEQAEKFAEGLNRDPDCQAWVKDLEESEKLIEEENKILVIKDLFEPEGIKSIIKYATSVEKIDDYMANYKVTITYDNYIKWLINECDYDEEDAKADADEWVKDLNESENLKESHNQEYKYMLLDRLRQDCEYYLGNGGKNPQVLWAGNEQGQIAEMIKIYNQLEEKPEWLTMDQIKEYAKQMGVPELPSSEDGTAKETIQKQLDKNYKETK